MFEELINDYLILFPSITINQISRFLKKGYGLNDLCPMNIELLYKCKDIISLNYNRALMERHFKKWNDEELKSLYVALNIRLKEEGTNDSRVYLVVNSDIQDFDSLNKTQKEKFVVYAFYLLFVACETNKYKERNVRRKMKSRNADLKVEVVIPAATKRELEFTSEMIGKAFADDIIKFVKNGGSLKDLCALNVYRVIEGKKSIPLNFDRDEFKKNIKNYDDSKLLVLYDEVILQLDDKELTEYRLFKLLGIENRNFNELTKKQKREYLEHAYYLLAVKHASKIAKEQDEK
ncbi:MAG: hypothetical protein IJS83_03695 [Acholeplasmatales bacterium]|nr:hypothetical protein [Acholeplasmatales bacterium]